MHTKIIVSIGAQYNDTRSLKKFIKLGTDIFRINMAHGSHAWHSNLIKRIRSISKKIEIEADISGPKVRTGDCYGKSHFIELKRGGNVTLSTISCNPKKIYVPCKKILELVKKDTLIYIADGTIQLKVLSKTSSDIKCKSLVNGIVGERKTIVVPHKDFGLPSLTEKDWEDLKFIAKHNINYLGFSMIKNSTDILNMKEFFSSKKSKTKIIAKIETKQAVKNLNKIIKVSDAIMVARGDLGIAVPIQTVPSIEYDIIQKCNKAHKFVIVATEMLNSMKLNPIPTRAEVNDIYTAVSAGANAVLLAGETNDGKYPFKSVQYMNTIVREAEKNPIRI